MRRFRERQRPSQREGPRGEPGRAGPNVVFGAEPVSELVLAAPHSIETLHVRAGDERRFSDAAQRVRAAGGRVVIAREGELEQLVDRDARHQGVAAIVREYHYADLEDIVRDAPDPILFVDGVTDPRNLGALLRSADGAGIRAVVLARDRTAGVTPAAVKSSAGAWVHLRIARCGNVARTLRVLKEAGYWIVALAPGAGMSVYDFDAARKLVVVVGSEGEGIRSIVRKAA